VAVPDDLLTPAPGPDGSGPPPLVKPGPISRAQLIFLGALASIALVAVILFAWLATRCVIVPTALIAFVSAFGTAILVYSFLGGAAGYFTTLGVRLGGSAAVFAAVLLLIHGMLGYEMEMRVRSCEPPPERVLLEKRPQRLPGGARISLENISAIRHSPRRIRNYPGIEEEVARLLHRANIDHDPSAVLNMSKLEWSAVLDTVDAERRRAVEDTPLAHIVVEAGDQTRPQTVLKADTVAAGRHQLCIRHILNARDESREPEAIIYTDGSC